jgi:glutathione synthase
MTKYNILILTDHLGHNPTNSVYGLSKALRLDDRCGHCWVCSRGLPMNELFFKGKPGGGIFGNWITLDFQFDKHGFFFQKDLEEIDPTLVDVVLIRLPQPVNIPFLHSLSTLFPNKPIINDPEGILETSSKAFLLQLSQWCPPVTLCHSLEEAISLSHQYEIVLKPLYSFGGHGLMRLSREWCWDGNNRFPIEDVGIIFNQTTFPMLAMQFLKNVVLGDKRTIVANKKILGSAIRMPAEDHWICNVSKGGHALPAVPDEEELAMEAVLTPLLYKKGIVLYGFDTLVNDEGKRVLSEINTMSVGGLWPLQEMMGSPVVEDAAQGILDYVDAFHSRV